MSSSTPKPPSALVQYIQQGRCVLFAGAGLSMQAGLPSWTGLLRSLVAAVEEQSPGAGGAEIDKLFENNKLLEIADYCKKELGQGAYWQALTAQTSGTTEKLSEAHRLIAQTPFSAIVTTNYDHLLSRAYSANGGLPSTPTHLDTNVLAQHLFDGGFFILKAHGDIGRPESIVLTRKDFQQIIHSNPAFQAAFSTLLLTKVILFVGYSFNDPDFQLLLEQSLSLFSGYGPMRYALMNDVDEIEADVIWRTAHIRVISYKPSQRNHPEVVEFLRQLARLSQPEPKVRLVVEGDPDSETRRRQLAQEVVNVEDLLSTQRPGFDKFKINDLLSRSFGAPAGGRPRLPRLGPVLATAEPLGPSKFPATMKPRELDPSFLPGTSRGLEEPSPESDDDSSSGPDYPFPGLPEEEPPSYSSIDKGPAPESTSPTTAWRLTIEQIDDRLSWELSGADSRTVHLSPAPRWPAIQTSLKERRFQLVAEALTTSKLKEFLQPLARGDSLTLELTRSTERYPWEWIEVDGEPICTRYRLQRAPIGVSEAARGLPSLGSSLSLLVIGDPTDSFPGAQREAEAVANLWQNQRQAHVTLLISEEATFNRVTEALASGAFDIVHFAGHAWADPEGAYLSLADDAQLRAEEMRSLLSPHPPAIVVLNSHFTAFVPAGVQLTSDDKMGTTRLPGSGGGRGGFTATATLSGVGAFLGCLGSPTDQGAANLAVAFHRGLIAGLTVNEALRHARRGLFEQGPQGDDWRYYVLSGSGELAIQLTE